MLFTYFGSQLSSSCQRQRGETFYAIAPKQLLNKKRLSLITSFTRTLTSFITQSTKNAILSVIGQKKKELIGKRSLPLTYLHHKNCSSPSKSTKKSILPYLISAAELTEMDIKSCITLHQKTDEGGYLTLHPHYQIDERGVMCINILIAELIEDYCIHGHCKGGRKEYYNLSPM